jgi:hypothetical protein
VSIHCAGIHLVPMGRERTWEKKGSKDIKVTGMEDKCQVTCCVSSLANGTFQCKLFLLVKQNDVYPKSMLQGFV